MRDICLISRDAGHLMKMRDYAYGDSVILAWLKPIKATLVKIVGETGHALFNIVIYTACKSLAKW